jgi:hypothetical protein
MRKVLVAIQAVLVVAGLMATLAHGEGLVTSIAFPFKAAGKTLPAGKYKIYTSQSKLLIRQLDGKEELTLPYLTRLAAKEGGPQVVFDKVGEDHFLSEIYLPGTDGYHLAGAPGKHTHVKVGVH